MLLLLSRVVLVHQLQNANLIPSQLTRDGANALANLAKHARQMPPCLPILQLLIPMASQTLEHATISAASHCFEHLGRISFGFYMCHFSIYATSLD
ncbi:hypothetical protein CPSG_06256 [Coccidioides posadasii str. Silveira]|uniref:Uncharacterized protein n=1 Tax=Coccidioides posadasii (strain RMSCC 757 / Silveira) TaxID=443226 RepID=E9D8V4_COCPS|nr:hypothetical protein CPSG_06256 [Coccidioides posadasii str. Silveira]